MVLAPDYGQYLIKIPKPFIEVSGKALIQHTIERVSEISDEIIIITNEANYYLTERTVNNASIKANIHYLLEPVVNTAPAIALSLNKIIEEFGMKQIVWFFQQTT